MPTEVKAELVGNVWKVEAKPGDTVEEDDILVILESMKMEIPVVAPVAGTVKEIRVKEQDVVIAVDLGSDRERLFGRLGKVERMDGSYRRRLFSALARRRTRPALPNVVDMLPLPSLADTLLGAINIMQEGIPDAIPAEACYLGWQESLRNLARLVEPEINQ